MANKPYDGIPRRRTDFQRQTDRMDAYNRAERESRINSGKAPAGCYDFLQLDSISADVKAKIVPTYLPVESDNGISVACLFFTTISMFALGIAVGMYLVIGGPM